MSMYTAETHRGDEQQHGEETCNATFLRYSHINMIAFDDGSLFTFLHHTIYFVYFDVSV